MEALSSSRGSHRDTEVNEKIGVKTWTTKEAGYGAEIRGSSDNAIQGQNFTLICSFSNTPQIWFTFKRKLITDDKNYDYFGFYPNEGNCYGGVLLAAELEFFNTSHPYACSDDRKLFYVYIPSVPSSWHDSEWTCGGAISTSNPVLKLYVAVPFTKAEITSAGDLVTNISSPVHAVCTSSPASRPQADISWTLRKTDGTLVDITSSSTQATDPNNNNPDTIKTTSSTLSYTPTDKRYNGANVYCQAANNKIRTQTSQERTLVVQYAPDGIMLLMSNTTGQLTEGMSVGLTCQVPGGNPLASLSWSCKGQPITSVNKSAGIVARWELQIRIDRSYDGMSCVCTGTHPLWTNNVNMPFSVLYPPGGTPELTSTPQKPFYLVNDSVTLTCKSPSTSKPAATITWSCKGQDITPSAANKNVRNIADSSLVIKVDSGYNEQLCVCTVSHPVNNYRQSVNITFNIHYFNDVLSGLTFESVKANSVHVRWTAGDNNGYEQTFHLSYQTEDSYKLTIDIPEEHSKRVYNVEVMNLDPGTTYRFQLTASNARGSNFNVLSRNVTTKQISEKIYLNDDPSTTSIALVAVSSVLLISTVIASIMNVLYFIKRHRQKSNDIGSRDVQDMKRHISIPSPNVYEDLGERDTPVESQYLHLQQSVSSDVKSNQGTSERYDELMARDPPSQYEEIQVDKTDKDYVNTKVK